VKEKREKQKKEEYTPKFFKEENDPKEGRKFSYIGHYWEDREQRIKNGNSNANNNNQQATAVAQPVAQPVEGSQKEEMK